ncbi:MAG: serine hydrolase domain-containing protein [Ginsengibacter sp.]
MNVLIKILLFLILFTCFSFASSGQPVVGIIGRINLTKTQYNFKDTSKPGLAWCPYSNKLDSFFNALSTANQGMGSIAISKNGNLIYSRSIGYEIMNDQKSVAATPNTKYRIGSITKMFTAVIILQLIEDKKLSLQTTIESYLPNIPYANLITIEDLLRHRTGLHHFAKKKFGNDPKTHEEMLAIINRGRPGSLPGLKFDYNDANYLLLGYIIEKISGKSFESVVNERIISKIKLKNAYCGHKTSIENNECYSYEFKKIWKQCQLTDMTIAGASGDIVASPTALTQFSDALFMGKLISDTSLSLMRSMDNGYGMGMMLFPYHTKNALGHFGSIDGFKSIVAYLPQDSISIAYSANGVRYPIQSIVMTAFDIYFGKGVPVSEMKFVKVETKHLRKYIGVYSNQQIPGKIVIYEKDKVLRAEWKEFTSLPLECIGGNKFRLEAADLEMEFDANRKGVNVYYGNNSYYFLRETNKNLMQ